MGQDVVEQLTTRSVLEDNTNVLVGFNDIVEPNDVGVLQDLKRPDEKGDVSTALVCAPKRRGRTRNTSISLSTLDMRTDVSMLPLLINFTATSSPHCMCRPSLTFPNSPSPNVCSSRYGPNLGMVRRG